MKKTAFLVALAIAFALVGTEALAGQKDGRHEDVFLKPTLDWPAEGTVVRAGDLVPIAWRAELPGCGPTMLGEQEVYLSVDGGRTFKYRITPRLLYTDRGYGWRVPNFPTASAVLDIRFGCEQAPGGCELLANVESSNPQARSSFEILGHDGVDDVSPVRMRAPEAPREGDRIDLTWQSRVADLDHFEVWQSVDRGGAWELAGTTERNAYRWTVPESSGQCRFYFKVVAVKGDGTRIDSVVDMDQFVYVPPN